MVVRQSVYAEENLLKDLLDFMTNDMLPQLLKTLAESDLPESRIAFVNGSVFDTYMEITFLNYTLGYDMRLVGDNLSNAVDAAIAYYSLKDPSAPDFFDPYGRLVHLFSLTTLLNQYPKNLVLLTQSLVNSDLLLARIVAHFDASILPPLKQLFPVFSQPLVEMLPMVDAEEISAHANKYLDGYFVAAKKLDATYYNTHKEKDPNYFFHIGYWVFELAALVVIMNWDDSAFRDHPIYPKDMVDWARANKTSN